MDALMQLNEGVKQRWHVVCGGYSQVGGGGCGGVRQNCGSSHFNLPKLGADGLLMDRP